MQLMVHEIGLVHRFGRQRTIYKEGQSNSFPPMTESLSTTFRNCLLAAIAYLECLFETLEEHLRLLPFEEWTRLTLAFFVLYKLSLGVSDVPEWDPVLARDACNLQWYLKRALTCLESIKKQHSTDLDTIFHMFPIILESTNTAYSLICQHPYMFPQGIQAHNLDFQNRPQPEAPKASASSCPGFQYLILPSENSRDFDDITFTEYVDTDIRGIESTLIGNESS